MVEETTLARRDEALPSRYPRFQGEQDPSLETLQAVLVSGNLETLSAAERLNYLSALCRSLNLNLLTQPIEFIKLSGRLVPYVKRVATDQLRKNHGVSVLRIEQKVEGDLFTATCYVRDRDGREDCDIGVVPIKGLVGDALANARMKGLTKAKRRATLSICGLGWLDDSEVDSIPGAQRVVIDSQTGEILSPPVRETTRSSVQRHETAPSYAAATIVPETPEARRERSVALLRAKLAEVTQRNLWDRDDLDLARWADYDFGAGTAEEIMQDTEALEVVLAIARRAEGYEQEAAAADIKACAVCSKKLTEGQYQVSLRAYNQALCPSHQREAKEVARG
jgi:hypothetical protein